MAVVLFLSACGTPGAPLAPSLNLPDPVNNLAATRTGDHITLTWKMPRRNTDKLLLKGELPVLICRKEENGPCEPVPASLQFAPNSAGSFTETLSLNLASGTPRVLSYFVELPNRNGRSAGLSNAAAVVAGQAPLPVDGLSATVVKAGVVLHWKAAPASSPITAIRIHRTLLSPPAAQPRSEPGLMAPAPELLEQTLLVEPTAGNVSTNSALDKDIHLGQTYEYRAQRVNRIQLGDETLELAGSVSAPVRVEANDIFPPAAPIALAAVATLGQPGTETAIDLSWQPVADADLAGYTVYRREDNGSWQRISSAQPWSGPAFHDTQVQPGHTYRYAVTAIDQLGHESARSTEAEETVPNP